MKLQKILDRFLRLHPKEIDLSLNRIDRLSKELGYPQNNLKIIELDMNSRNNSRSKENKKDLSKTRKKREELSESACRSIKRENVEVVISFS